ncbi:myo-inositol 2-dehydrogenase [Micromonospora coriariae]|uniref:Inositol 2-dehydrogenase n=1 Tax=Micromonospora coriariae TaxID=285665 RepID=A0A1C4U6L5_9ACTN|nr:Gfo/Idh/MocA family oxidoreductase [Micromonospora coriariae]SCE67314.1 myo-inositol 2-dehydrogenase [Micromonospora coriariae]
MTERPLRVGVIGVGTMGTDHADRLATRISGAELVAVADADSARAAEVAARYPGVRAIANPLDLIADDAVEAVLIASPGFAHEEQVLACLAHGKFSLCEKPLTMDSAAALRLVEVERDKAGRPLVQVGFMRRFDPEYAELRRLLDDGELGRLLLVHNIHRNRTSPAWFRDSAAIVNDSLVHEVDVCRWLFDAEIETVTLLTPTPSGRAPEGLRDPQVAIFQMAGGGVATTEVFVNSQVGYEVRCEAVAELGSATIGLGQEMLVRRGNAYAGRIPDDYRQRFARAYDIEVQEWARACRRGQVAGPTTWDGYAASVVCEAGVASLATGQPVRVELADRAEILRP